MLVLGINGGFGGGYQDVAAVLVENNTVLAAVEEERLNRIKHSKGQIPYLAIREVLDIADKNFSDVDKVAFHGATWGNQIVEDLQNYFQAHFGSCPKLELHHHHKCHAASVFYLSPFKNSLVITADNSGDGDSIHIYKASKGSGFQLLETYKRPQSFGVFYSLITQYCGFQKDRDEFKLMALAAMGKPNLDLSFLMKFENGKLHLNEAYLISIPPKTPSPTEQKMLFNEKFEQKIGFAKALPGNPSKFHFDLAASAQNQLEVVMTQLVSFWLKKTGEKNLCFAGGVALNGKLNGKLADLTNGKLYTNCCSNDSGISLGAAFLSNTPTRRVQDNPFLGRAFKNDEIENSLKEVGIKYQNIDDSYKTAQKLILDKKFIGFYKGKSEFGPRALVNRSILANPHIEEVKQKLNKRIKFREGFRPFGIVIREQDLQKYFETNQPASPFMNMVFKVTEGYKDLFKEVIHFDGTVRVQTVSNKFPLLSDDLSFVINTSFNHNKEPMVYAPIDAIRTFFGSGLDYLILENFLIEKPK